MVQVSEDGMIQDAKIVPKRYESLEQGPLQSVNGIIVHQTNARIASWTLAMYEKKELAYEAGRRFDDHSTLFKIFKSFNDGVGAHFLIAPDGTIYQTAGINKICHHIGWIKQRCLKTNRCDQQDILLHRQLHETQEKNDAAIRQAVSKIRSLEDLANHQKLMTDAAELMKLRSNKERTENAIVKAIQHKELEKLKNDRYPSNNDSIGIEVVGKPHDGEHYPLPSPQQLVSLKWLVKLLLQHFHLDKSHLYSHGEISPHKKQSEGVLAKDALLNLLK